MAKVDKEKIEALERELHYVKAEKLQLNTQVKKQKENIAEIRNQANLGRPGQAMSQLTEEVQKAHDLEYLLRNKERTIEILKGDADEAKAIRLETE